MLAEVFSRRNTSESFLLRRGCSKGSLTNLRKNDVIGKLSCVLIEEKDPECERYLETLKL